MGLNGTVAPAAGAARQTGKVSANAHTFGSFFIGSFLVYEFIIVPNGQNYN